MKKFFVFVLFSTLLISSCGVLTVSTPFFTMKAPQGMVMLDLPEGMRFKIALGMSKHEIKMLTDITNSIAFMSFSWTKSENKLGDIKNLKTGTMPTGAFVISQGQESVNGFLAWCEQTEQKSVDNNQVLRIIHRCAIPFDGGLLEILSSTDPRSKVTVEDMKDALRTLDIFDKNYFIDLKTETK